MISKNKLKQLFRLATSDTHFLFKGNFMTKLTASHWELH